MDLFGEVTTAVFHLLLLALVTEAGIRSTSFKRCHEMKDNVYTKGLVEETEAIGRMTCVSRCGIIENCSCAVPNLKLNRCRLYDHCFDDDDNDKNDDDDDESDSSSECWNKYGKTILTDEATGKHTHLSTVSATAFTSTKMFGDQCSESGDCGYNNGHCLEGTCSCSIGYSYDFDKKECLTSCSRYGTAFSGYRDTSIGGCNIKEIFQLNKELCLKRCRDERSFICISCEFFTNKYAPIGTCSMCNKPWRSLREQQRRAGNAPGWFLYYRHCQN